MDRPLNKKQTLAVLNAICDLNARLIGEEPEIQATTIQKGIIRINYKKGAGPKFGRIAPRDYFTSEAAISAARVRPQACLGLLRRPRRLGGRAMTPNGSRDNELVRVRELLHGWDSLGAGSLAPSARRREEIAHGREAHDARLVARDLRREHYQTDDGWVTEPLSNEGTL